MNYLTHLSNWDSNFLNIFFSILPGGLCSPLGCWPLIRDEFFHFRVLIVFFFVFFVLILFSGFFLFEWWYIGCHVTVSKYKIMILWIWCVRFNMLFDYWIQYFGYLNLKWGLFLIFISVLSVFFFKLWYYRIHY